MRHAAAKRATLVKALVLAIAAARADGVDLPPHTAVLAVIPSPVRAMVSLIRSNLAAQLSLRPLWQSQKMHDVVLSLAKHV
jgi:hypothetical protein